MRVIAGKARRLILKTTDGPDTRPTTDRIKETLFNILQPDLYGCLFLDLFAGSGGIGIEALSRGAREAVFVDSSSRAAAVIRENLQKTRLADQAGVMCADVLTALPRLENHGRFDIIFMDPPYGKELENQVLRYLKNSSLADEETMIIVETAAQTDLSQAAAHGFEITREKMYKTNKHVFLRKTGESDHEESSVSGEL